MKFLIDTQQSKLAAKQSAFPDLVGGQLQTPLTGYRVAPVAFGVDNGAFSGFDGRKFRRLLTRLQPHADRCMFVACPDIVGNARRTLELWRNRDRWGLESWPAAFVAQDGAEDVELPFGQMSALFIGGSDAFKESRTARDLIRVAQAMQLHTHVGRVNTYRRWQLFSECGVDTCDGSGVARYDWMLEKIQRRRLRANQPGLF